MSQPTHALPVSTPTDTTPQHALQQFMAARTWSFNWGNSRGNINTARLLLCGVLIMALLALHGCGFRLQGPSPLPFDTLYTNISLNSSFGAQLERILKANTAGLQFYSERDQAQAALIELENSRRTREVALDPQGNVEEYQLNLHFSFELLDKAGRKVLPPTSLMVTRYLPNDPDATQAKESERDSLYASMEEELIERIARRLTAPDVRSRFDELASQPDTPDEPMPDVPLPQDSGQTEEEILPLFDF